MTLRRPGKVSLCNKEKTFKVVLLGKGCVGKTTMALMFCNNKYDENPESTRRVSYFTKVIRFNNIDTTLSIWDTAGQEYFHALGPIYYRESEGAVIVYDVTEKESLERAKYWVSELKAMLEDSVCLALVGNKKDLFASSEEAMNSSLVQDAIKYSNTVKHCKHYLTSAIMNDGLNLMFKELSIRMLERYKLSKLLKNVKPNSNYLLINEDDENEERPRKSCFCQ